MMLSKCLLVSERLYTASTRAYWLPWCNCKFVIFKYGCQDNLCWLSETYSAPSHEILLQGNMVPDFTVHVKLRVKWRFLKKWLTSFRPVYLCPPLFKSNIVALIMIWTENSMATSLKWSITGITKAKIKSCKNSQNNELFLRSKLCTIQALQ